MTAKNTSQAAERILGKCDMKSCVGNPIWSATKGKTPVENAFKHWKDHKNEFPEFLNSKQYVESSWNFFKRPPVGTLVKKRTNGETLLYHEATNTFGVCTKHEIPKTMFRPNEQIRYWEGL